MPDIIKELIKKSQNGDKKAFNTLYKRYGFFLYKICQPFANAFKDPQDLLQEGSIAFIKAINTYKVDSEVNFSIYLKKIVRNHLINYIN